MDTLHLFISFVETHRYWGYVLLFLTMLVEGELFLAAAGMLARLHAFDFFDAFIFAFGGVLTGDILWYSAGRYFNHHHSHNRYINAVIDKVKHFLPGIEKNPFHVIFLSKFIYGLNHSTIFVLGYLKTEFWHFFRIQFWTSFLWSTIFLAVGYIFGGAAIKFAHSMNKFVIVVILFLVAVVVVERIIGRVVEKKENETK